MWANTNRWVFARYCSGRRSRFGKRNYFRAKCTPQSRSGRFFFYLPWHRWIWEDCFRRHWPAYSTNRSITPKLFRVSLSAHGLNSSSQQLERSPVKHASLWLFMCIALFGRQVLGELNSRSILFKVAERVFHA
jgi:hypothetical protein